MDIRDREKISFKDMRYIINVLAEHEFTNHVFIKLNKFD